MQKGKFADGLEESENRVNGMGNIAIAESLVDGIADCFIEEAIQYKENKARMELPEENSRVYRNGRTTKRWYATLGFRLAACVALGILIGFSSIMGETAAGNLRAYEYLYKINSDLAESMMPIQKTCTDQGIEVKVEAVKIQGRQANVYISLRDLTGDRIDRTTDLFDSYRVNTNCDQASGFSLVSYDEETKTASFLIQIDQHTEKFAGKRLTFHVSKLLLQKQEVTMDLPQIHLENLKEKTQDELYEASELEFRGQGGLGLEKFGKETKYAWHYLKPDEKQAFQAVRGAGITAYGLVDGMLHVQVYYEDIIQKDNHGDIRLKDENGKEYICLGNISFWDKEHKGSYEEYLFEPMDDGDFKDFMVVGWFVTGAELLEGDWEISFPIENLEE